MVHLQVSLDDVKVRPADTTGADPDQDLVGRGLRYGYIAEP